MTERAEDLIKSIERFDDAALDWGWQRDMGTGGVGASMAEYDASKADLMRAAASALQDERDGGWDSGYLAGFKASGEGWNGEFPFEGRAPELDEHWLATRDKSRPPHSKDSEG